MDQRYVMLKLRNDSYLRFDTETGLFDTVIYRANGNRGGRVGGKNFDEDVRPLTLDEAKAIVQEMREATWVG
jgi:hypothetical protein